MATLKSKKLQEALKRATNVGRAEEAVVIDGCHVVLRSLAPAGHEEIARETADLDGLEFLHAYQMGHVCRAVVELEGIDLREVAYIEDDVPDGLYLINAVVSRTQSNQAHEELKKLGIQLTVVPPDMQVGEKEVLVERSEWLRQKMANWSREAVTALYRKLTDVTIDGERRAQEKIEFRTTNETSEDKYRRLLSEAKEVENDIPPSLLQSILSDAGYLQKSTADELAEVDRRARAFAIDQEKREPDPVADPVADPVQQAGGTRDQALADRLRNRVPLNQTDNPVPVQSPVHQAASRAAQIQALEGLQDGDMVPQELARYDEIPEITGSRPRIDSVGANSILDKPPTVGLNPRFRRSP